MLLLHFPPKNFKRTWKRSETQRSGNEKSETRSSKKIDRHNLTRDRVVKLPQFRSIADFEVIVKQLEEGCQKCMSSPLLLTDNVFSLNSETLRSGNEKSETRSSKKIDRHNLTRDRVVKLPQFRSIADFEVIVKQLEEGCQKCMSSPLLLTDSVFSLNCYPNRSIILCRKCDSENRIAIHSDEVEDKVALASIHTDTRHSRTEGISAQLVYQASYIDVSKNWKRKVGTEEVAKDSYHKRKL